MNKHELWSDDKIELNSHVSRMIHQGFETCEQLWWWVWMKKSFLKIFLMWPNLLTFFGSRWSPLNDLNASFSGFTVKKTSKKLHMKYFTLLTSCSGNMAECQKPCIANVWELLILLRTWKLTSCTYDFLNHTTQQLGQEPTKYPEKKKHSHLINGLLLNPEWIYVPISGCFSISVAIVLLPRIRIVQASSLSLKRKSLITFIPTHAASFALFLFM